MKIRYADLTTQQKEYICNGCGPKGLFVPVPGFIFTASCNHHDFNYWLGHREQDRLRADLQFYFAMRHDARQAPWWRRYFYRFWAWTYYKAVRAGGRKSFYYGEKERTLEDLQREMDDG